MEQGRDPNSSQTGVHYTSQPDIARGYLPKIGKDRTCSSRDMLANRQTHRQTRSSQYSAPRCMSFSSVVPPNLVRDAEMRGKGKCGKEKGEKTT